MGEGKFFECVLCDKKEQYSEAVEDLAKWDFGVDFDEAEPDEDGGIRGEHRRCRNFGDEGDTP